MARSEQWQTTLDQNGWEDSFLAGADFRQFLLAEQARVEAVLRRLAAGETAAVTAHNDVGHTVDATRHGDVALRRRSDRFS